MENQSEQIVTFVDQAVAFAYAYGPKVLGALIILIIGRILAGIIRGLLKKALNKSKVDPTFVGFAGNMAYGAILVFAVVAALGKFGVETASIIAVMGAVAFAVGLALQGSLANFASGVMLLLFRPFRVGDFVEVADVAGSVKEIDLLTTIMDTPDNLRIIVPNGKIFGDIIKNYSTNDTRRMDIPCGIAYGASIGDAQKVAMELVQADDRILKDPAPAVVVGNLGDSSVDLIVRFWVKRVDFWDVKFDMTKGIKEKLDNAGIEIPFPQRVVHMKQS